MSPVVTEQCLEGLVAGIIEMSQEIQMTINLLVKERDQDKIKTLIKQQKERYEVQPRLAETISKMKPTAPWEDSIEPQETGDQGSQEWLSDSIEQDTTEERDSQSSESSDNNLREVRLSNKRAGELELRRV